MHLNSGELRFDVIFKHLNFIYSYTHILYMSVPPSPLCVCVSACLCVWACVYAPMKVKHQLVMESVFSFHCGSEFWGFSSGCQGLEESAFTC